MMSDDSDGSVENGQTVSHKVREQTNVHRPTTQDVKAQKYKSFEELGIKKDLLLGLGALGFKTPTPVQ